MKKIIQQRIWRKQLNLLHIKWQEGNEAYEDELKAVLYPLEEEMINKGWLPPKEPPESFNQHLASIKNE